MTRLIFDEETGELLREVSDREIINIYQYEDLQRRKISKKYFIKLYQDTLAIFYNNDIHYSIFKTFFKLIRFMNFDNEFLSLNGLPLNINQISKVCKINLSTLKKHIKKLEKLEILKRVKNGRNRNIIINPYFVGYGKDNTNISIQIFSKSIWARNYKK